LLRNIINAEPFNIGYNSYLVLLHLRSPTHPITIWIDETCINQAYNDERSQQVPLMAFIYRRATKVVAWLGVHDCPPKTDHLRSMLAWWKDGDTQHLGASLVGEGGMQLLSCVPRDDLLKHLVESTYRKRQWVVQEACLPLHLVFVFGSDMWTYEGFQKFAYQAKGDYAIRELQSNPAAA
jgi:hypothetical protein